MAERAHHRARSLCDSGASNVTHVGLALVAALPTDPPRRGGDRIHVALHSQPVASQWSLRLPKDAFTRSLAETISDEMLFQAMATLVPGHSNEAFFAEAALAVEMT